MRRVFADTEYWIALWNPYDDLHDKSLEISNTLGPAQIVTSEMVIVETLNGFSKRGQQLREQAFRFAGHVISNANVLVVPQTSALFREALDMFGKRPDKKWSLTDCASFIIMKEKEITEALAKDEHFEQAGFVALLKDK
jgi:predicted nucleic acid-binding protein